MTNNEPCCDRGESLHDSAIANVILNGWFITFDLEMERMFRNEDATMSG